MATVLGMTGGPLKATNVVNSTNVVRGFCVVGSLNGVTLCYVHEHSDVMVPHGATCDVFSVLSCVTRRPYVVQSIWDLS